MSQQDWPELPEYEQRDLAEAMSALSERCYCAVWLSGCEVSIWRLIHEGGSWGMSTLDVDDDDLERIRRAANTAGCWIEWRDGEARAVALAEWRERVSA